VSVTYYWHPTPCPTCGHGETLEIGSHGAGWVFTLKAYEGLTTWKEWKLFLLQSDGLAKDYAGGTYTANEVIRIVESREGKGLLSNADTHPRHYTRDSDGFTIQRTG
jgi:hypothetical protein